MLCECSVYCLGRPTKIYHPSDVLGPRLELFPYQQSLFWQSVLTGKCTLRRGERYVSCQVPGGASGAHTDWRDLPYYILTATATPGPLPLQVTQTTATTLPTHFLPLISQVLLPALELHLTWPSVGGEKIIWLCCVWRCVAVVGQWQHQPGPAISHLRDHYNKHLHHQTVHRIRVYSSNYRLPSHGPGDISSHLMS